MYIYAARAIVLKNAGTRVWKGFWRWGRIDGIDLCSGSVCSHGSQCYLLMARDLVRAAAACVYSVFNAPIFARRRGNGVMSNVVVE